MRIPTITAINDPDLADALDYAINNKTKPLGSLGILEAIAKQVGLIQQTTAPQLRQPAILVFAGDHGITEEKVSPYPQSVTWQMVENFLAQGAAINVFARQNQCALHIIDAGVNHDFGQRDSLIDRKIAYGTKNFAQQPAMTTGQCQHALEAGYAIADMVGGNVIGFGEMGIGNTTAAAALMHKLTGIPLNECVGAGAGMSVQGIAHKRRVLEAAIERHGAVAAPLEILATFGGFEIAMMAGAMLQAAHQRKILLIDGFIVTGALLVAAALQPAIVDYCVFSHCSDENGHRRMLQFLQAKPLLQLGLRLGEGSGAALAYPLLQASVNFLTQMATFESAKVSGQRE